MVDCTPPIVHYPERRTLPSQSTKIAPTLETLCVERRQKEKERGPARGGQSENCFREGQQNHQHQLLSTNANSPMGSKRASEASEEFSPPGLVTERQAAGETARRTIRNEKGVMLNADLQEGTTLLTRSIPNALAKDQRLQRTKARTTTSCSDHLNEPRQQSETPPVLEINVPDIELERYSVMFGNLLQSYQRTSLLVRRGTNSDIHRPPNGAAAMADHINAPDGATQQRWVTSAPPAKSSTFSLFPRSEPSQPRATSMAIHRPRLLKRSYTAPAVPSRATATSAQVEGPVLVPPLPSSRFSEKALPLTPTHSDRMSFSEEEIALVSHGLGPSIPQVEEPPWEMITTRGAPPQRAVPSIEEQEEIMKHFEQVSVARKISLSRAKSKSLRRVESKQPVTPMLVELEHRRSTMVMIENA
ncbi:hypothetical protein B0A49_00910 [Cryomyces minteri]|uniref:Uncharacterized protein n=1 Tax=Cryomyces minteri TaxID=331657 RepID=A0A4U0XPB6_9PEZI|nr:hypothetical protein B0A49_00910 [Cryomyces minteri]